MHGGEKLPSQHSEAPVLEGVWHVGGTVPVPGEPREESQGGKQRPGRAM